MKSKALALIRKNAVYFVVGPWPAIVQAQLPEAMNLGKRYAVAIIPVED